MCSRSLTGDHGASFAREWCFDPSVGGSDSHLCAENAQRWGTLVCGCGGEGQRRRTGVSDLHRQSQRQRARVPAPHGRSQNPHFSQRRREVGHPAFRRLQWFPPLRRGRTKMGRPRLWLRWGRSKASDRSVRPTRAKSKAAGKSARSARAESKSPLLAKEARSGAPGLPSAAVVPTFAQRAHKDGASSFVVAVGKVKGVGQECPTYTGKVKGSGQECPLRTGGVRIPTSRKGGEKWGTRPSAGCSGSHLCAEGAQRWGVLVCGCGGEGQRRRTGVSDLHRQSQRQRARVPAPHWRSQNPYFSQRRREVGHPGIRGWRRAKCMGPSLRSGWQRAGGRRRAGYLRGSLRRGFRRLRLGW